MTYRFSVLLAVYNVDQYLDAALRSLRAQTVGFKKIQIIAVDDGSSDESLSILRRWADRYPNITIISQENAGPGAARAEALRHATGEWVTSIDPDDLVARDYFEAVENFLSRDENGHADLLASRVYVLNDATGKFSDTHPLAQKFRFGDRLARLADEPAAFQLGATAFMRRAVLVEHALTYDPNIRPTFEDAHLLARYLRTSDDPTIGLVASAHYYYRKRRDESSVVQSSWSLPERYSVVPRKGYLDILESFAEIGKVPAWVQYMVLYDILWYLKEDLAMNSKVAWVDGDLRDQFTRTLDEIMRYIDREVIETFPCNPHPWTLRQALIVRFDKVDDIVPLVYRWADHRGLAHLTMLYRGDAPEVEVFVDGISTPLVDRDFTSHSYFGQEYMVEDRVTVRAGQSVAVFVDGVLVEQRRVRRIEWGRPPKKTYSLRPRESSNERLEGIRRKVRGMQERAQVEALTLGVSMPAVIAGKRASWLERTSQRSADEMAKSAAQALVARSARPEVRARYQDAWVLIDRPGKADDNAEHLYRYLRAERPDVNAWFLLERNSPDWDRLQTEGFRLVEYGSDEAVLLVHNARVCLSSDATADVMFPAGRAQYKPLPSKFVFLQHGITMNDLSRWLNPKRISLLVTASRAEYEGFVGRKSPYRLGNSQVALTGFARFDRLLRAKDRVNDPTTLLVAPTWRGAIKRALAELPSGQRVPFVLGTEYWQRWSEVLADPRLHELARQRGLNIKFLPHPSLAPLVEDATLPAGIERIHYQDISFQQVLASSAALLTDYSSVSFDAAYIGIPVIYYQFDRAELYSGGHNFRLGYFDYNRDGLGPVEGSVDGVIKRLETVARRGYVPEPEFLERASATFAYRDDANCDRIVEATEKMLGDLGA